MKFVGVKLGDDIYNALVEKSRKENVSISELVRKAVEMYLGIEVKPEVKPEIKPGELDEIRNQLKLLSNEVAELREKIKNVESGKSVDAKSIVDVVKRKIDDYINPFTAKVDEIAKRLAIVEERISMLEEKASKIDELEKAEESKKQKPESKPKKSAMDILKEVKVVFESDVATKIRDRDAFFTKLEREGAKVFKGYDQRVAVDPAYWEAFVKKLQTINTTDEEKIKKMLDGIEHKLFDWLNRNALIYFDGSAKCWKTSS